jgi:hypothetical protein
MPTRNKGNRGLPARWRHYHGAYYYRVPPGLEPLWDGHKQYRLGTTLAESATEWAKRMRTAERPAAYIKQLLERYAIEVIPTKAAATQRGDNLALVNLRKVLREALSTTHFTLTEQLLMLLQLCHDLPIYPAIRL